MGLIPTESLDAIRSRLDIIELVREYVPEVRQVGRSIKARCPFHQERTPSFIVSPERQSFHCFGCGVGGDAFAFLMKIENLSFSEAVEKLAQRTGVKIVTAQEALGPADRERMKIKEALEFAADFYHDILLKSSEAAPARSYLAGRGVSAETIASFKLGFASPRANLILNAGRKGFPVELLIKAGLAADKEGKQRDYFYNRVLYPIRDARGSVVGFGARTLGDSQPKYLNSPDSPVFSKGKVLYGLFHGLAEIRKARRALLMEGYMDVMAAHQHGIKTACAPLGTALTPDQAGLLKRYVSEVTIVFDSDKAGFAAALRGAEGLLAQGLRVRIATVPEGKDPDEHLLKFGAASFEKCLDQSVDLAEFQTELVLKNYPTALKPEDKAEVAKIVLATITQCADEVLKGEWVHRLAQRLKTSEEALLRQFHKETTPQRVSHSRASHAPPAPQTPLSSDDKEILLLLFKQPDLGKLLQEGDIDSPTVRRIAAVLSEVSAKTASWSASLLETLEPGDRELASQLLVDSRKQEAPEASLRAILESRRRKARLKELEPLVLAMGGSNPVDSTVQDEYRKLIAELKGSAKAR